MNDKGNHLYTDNTETLQISYKEYVALVEKSKEGQRCRAIKEQVLADLAGVLGDRPEVRPKEVPPQKPEPAKTTPEPTAKEPEPEVGKKVDETDGKAPAAPAATKEKPPKVDVPPIKRDIAEHFNKVDGSGRLLNVFKQYYTCVNEVCGGTVRVTIKDGICSFWNYDEWEEFAYVDVFDGCLRIAVDPRYTEQLESLDLCEVSRLLASRHSLVCVQVDDLNQTMLDILVAAFNEVGVIADKVGVAK